jgi:dimethylargininase
LFRHAIVRTPGENFADGLTTAKLGRPDLPTALRQHQAYCRALENCGLTLVWLDTDHQHPDSTFVEDTAVLTTRSAILARPGAASRLGELTAIRNSIGQYYKSIHQIEAPGTLDGGDICEAEAHFFIGISQRTNEEGARQLSRFLAADGFTSSTVDIRGMSAILHLKSGVAYLNNRDLVVMDELAGREEFSDYNPIRVSADESYVCNCVLVNERVLVPAGYSHLQAGLASRGYDPLPLEMSEFRKMDGGLSCLSLRF